MLDYFEDNLVPLLFVAILLFILGAVVLACIDTVQERRAFARIAACRTAQKEAMRPMLSTRVVCVPALNRRDTTAVQVQP